MIDPQSGRMSDGEFRLFKELIRNRCGLHFEEQTRFLLEKRIATRMEKCGIPSLSAYHYQLRQGSWREGELAELIDELTTNETYFFREEKQLGALIAEILPEALGARQERGGGAVRLWSAGCSSGEEPYSIAMLAQEAGFEVGRELCIYASDISRRVLSRARRGSYREGAFRETDPALRRRYFSEKDGAWTISDQIKQQVSFVHVNLFDPTGLSLLEAMDVVLCRNVIIYFDAEGKRQVIEAFENKLRPGGHLLLGHSESLMSLSSSLELRHLKNDLVYRKPASGLGQGDPWHLAAQRAIGSADDE